jgi:hypothetical protein
MSVEKYLDFLIQLNTKQSKHIETNLLTHLQGVYNYLLVWNCPKEIQLAGLFHSIYSTDEFKTKSLSFEKRPELQKLIGRSAENLVYIYCCCSEKSFQNSVLNNCLPQLQNRFSNSQILLSKQEYNALLWVRLANILDIETRTQQNLPTNANFIVYWLGRKADAYFWRIVAENLQGKALMSWNSVFGQILKNYQIPKNKLTKYLFRQLLKLRYFLREKLTR